MNIKNNFMPVYLATQMTMGKFPERQILSNATKETQNLNSTLLNKQNSQLKLFVQIELQEQMASMANFSKYFRKKLY